VTVVHDGEEYFYLSRGEQPVTHTAAIVGRFHCAGCGTTQQGAEMTDLTNLEYARDYVQTRAMYAALHHAKTCNRRESP
jgi:hypothetical protein